MDGVVAGLVRIIFDRLIYSVVLAVPLRYAFSRLLDRDAGYLAFVCLLFVTLVVVKSHSLILVRDTSNGDKQ